MKKDPGSKRGKLFSFISILCATAMLVQCAPMTGLAEEIGKPASAAVTYSTPADTTTDESAKSGQVQLTTQDLINAPLLTAPTNLSASSITNTGLTLSWTASTGTGNNCVELEQYTKIKFNGYKRQFR